MNHFAMSTHFLAGISGGLPAAASHYTALFDFGDSLSDAGNVFHVTLGVVPTPLIYSDGRFSNGAVWVQDLAKLLNLPIPHASLTGGTDYAYGGAETGNEPLHTVNPFDLPSQLAQFAANVGHASGTALFALTIGANDVIDAIGAYAGNPSGAVADIHDAVGNELGFLNALALDGAKNFLVMNVPDLGKTPEESGNAAVATQLSSLYNGLLAQGLTALASSDHVSVHLLDAFSLIDQAVSDPKAFGFSNVTEPLWTGNYENPLSGTFTASGQQAAHYLFFDHLHPTAFGHEAVAQAAFATLGSPAHV